MVMSNGNPWAPVFWYCVLSFFVHGLKMGYFHLCSKPDIIITSKLQEMHCLSSSRAGLAWDPGLGER